MSEVLYRRINAHEVSYKATGQITYEPLVEGGSSHIGKAVKRAGQATVDLTSDGSEVFGRLQLVEPDGTVTIMEQGYESLPFTGTMTYGDGSFVVGSATRGSVKAGTAVTNVVNQAAMPITVDPTNAARVMVMWR